jgi:hypothetical protein
MVVTYIMSCRICPFFLHDFLLTGIPEGLSLRKEMKLKVLPKISWLFATWIHQVYHRLEHKHFQKAAHSASLIAKRGRSDIEYEYLTSTATFNFLKYEVPWLQQEEDYMEILLMENGLFKGKNLYRLMLHIKDYIRYTTIRSFYLLQQIHEDHVNPKGLMTSLDHLVVKKAMERNETLSDRDDDYQKEILEEIDLSDLYT